MPLTTAQLQTLKADIAANNTTIPAGIPDAGSFVGTAIKNIAPGNTDGAYAAAYANAMRVDVIPEISDFDRWFNVNGTGLDRVSAKAGWDARGVTSP